MEFKIIGKILQKEIIAKGKGIKELKILERIYGHSKWRKVKGIATIQFSSGNCRTAEIHWYRGAWHWQEKS